MTPACVLLLLDSGHPERLALEDATIQTVPVDARDVTAARRALESGRYHLAVLDLRFPGLDGAGVLAAARTQDSSIPIVVLAGRSDEELVLQLMQLGAWDVITESCFSNERLSVLVRRVTRLRHAEFSALAERQRLQRLQRFTAAVATKRTVAEVAETTVSELRQAFEAPRSVFCVLDDDGKTINVIRVDGFSEAVVAPWRRIPIDAPMPLAEAMRLSLPLFFEDSASLMKRYPHLREQRVDGDEALIVLPLVVERRAIGAIGLIYDNVRRISAEDRTELIALVQVCAQALDRAYLLEVAQRERRHAEEANRAKDEFLAVVSHELRTPLNAILGWANMLNAGSLSPQQAQKATRTIERNARAQAQLIDDLLDVSRIITGQMRIKGEPLDLAAVLDAALDIVRPAADAKGVALHRELDHGPAPLLGDGDRLQQVFWNLLSNAVKFTPRGGRVLVRLAAAESHFVVEVEDSGQASPVTSCRTCFSASGNMICHRPARREVWASGSPSCGIWWSYMAVRSKSPARARAEAAP